MYASARAKRALDSHIYIYVCVQLYMGGRIRTDLSYMKGLLSKGCLSKMHVYMKTSKYAKMMKLFEPTHVSFWFCSDMMYVYITLYIV